MGLMDVFWIFLIVMSLQPMLRQRLVQAARARMIQRIEQRRGSRLILLVHRQETMSFLGFPVFRYINVDDAEQVIRAIHMTGPKTPLDIVLHTPGGLVLPSLQIARALARHEGMVTVFVPHYAMSGGTLIALAADAIVMSDHAVLGPVDPQIGQFPAASLVNVVAQKPVADIDDQTLILADQAEKALHQLKNNVQELVCKRMEPDACADLATQLASGQWTHDFAITPEHATRLGLPVSTDMPDDLFELMNLYAQPVRQRPSVEYLPIPRGVPAPRAEPK